ncbi:unnamed protein product, partial [Hymenolepis diminuta]
YCQKKLCRRGGRSNHKNGFTVNKPVYARDYRLSRQWTTANRYGSMIYDVRLKIKLWFACSSNRDETFTSVGRSTHKDLRIN